MTIEKVAVIGSGVMGAGIAAHLANSHTKVVLLDIVPDSAADRNHLAKRALAAMKKSQPAQLMDPAYAEFITPGNLEDDLDKLADCDWIIEAVLEDLAIKKALYEKIEKFRKTGAVISSNTSTLPLSLLIRGMPKRFGKNFLITHFFNPPRYMRLVELVTNPEADPQAVGTVTDFLDRSLGKNVVYCHDTPGFIGNRIGTYWLQLAITEAVQQQIDVEAADFVLSRPLGIPKTGVFGLLDLVGLDLLPHILTSLGAYLPKDDPFHDLSAPPPLLEKMIKDGYTGRKGKGGFYRLNKEHKKEVISLRDGSYRLAKREIPAAAKAGLKNIQSLLNHDSKEGRYAWKVMSETLLYAASLVPQIADDIESVDRAMRLGYNWKYGPFELLDRIGVSWFTNRLRSEKRAVPALLAALQGRSFYRVANGRLQFHDLGGDYTSVKRPARVLLLADIKRRTRPILHNRSASLWDIGDHIACLEFHSKMNSLNLFTLAMLKKTVQQIPNLGFKGLVIYNEGTHFSVGANLLMLLVIAKLRLWPLMSWILRLGQQTFQKLKYAPFPVVGAPSGMTLGGGCEVLMHCHAVEAHAESYIGLVETGVGIVPGWGGCKELLGRTLSDPKTPKGPMAATMQAFETIAKATVAKSAPEARKLHFLKSDDGIIMNRDRLLNGAKDRALVLADNYEPPTPYSYHLAGPSGKAALRMGLDEFVRKGAATKHDAEVALALAEVLSGGECDHTETLTEDDILALERQAILTLVKTQQTRDRIAHMLKTGKPLRN